MGPASPEYRLCTAPSPHLLCPGSGSVTENPNKEAEHRVCSGHPWPPQPLGTRWPPPPGTAWPALSMPPRRGPDSDGEPGRAGRGAEPSAHSSASVQARGSQEETSQPASPGLLIAEPRKERGAGGWGCLVGVQFEIISHWFFLSIQWGMRGQYLLMRWFKQETFLVCFEPQMPLSGQWKHVDSLPKHRAFCM